MSDKVRIGQLFREHTTESVIKRFYELNVFNIKRSGGKNIVKLAKFIQDKTQKMPDEAR